jgi:hypothetical protein
MSFIQDHANSLTKDQQAKLGNTSDALRSGGAHVATIEEVFETQAANYKALTIKLSTPGGSVRIFEFGGTPKSESAEDIEKANKSTKKVVDILARMNKAIGFKDIATGCAGAQAGTDPKQNATTIFPKYVGKKLTIITYAQIEPSQDGTKVYANQVVDTYTFLDKDGKDAMGRDRAEALGTDAETRAEIHWQHKDNPLCVAKLAQVEESFLGQVAVTPLAEMPTGAAPTPTPAAVVAPAIENDDI